MRTSRRTGLTIAAAVSAAAHLVLLVAVAIHSPTLFIPDSASGPPQPIIPILMAPRLPPNPVTGAPPAPIRLHRRPQRQPQEEDLPIAPLYVPEILAVAPAARPEPRLRTRASVDDQVQATLRALSSCTNRESLSAEARDVCDQRLAAGARDAPLLGLAEGGRDLADQAAIRARDYRYARPIAPSGPYAGMGDSAEEIGRR